jgi:hypothetical protein
VNYLVNILLAVAFVMALAGHAPGVGEVFEIASYITACALAALSLIVGAAAASRAVPLGRETSPVCVGNDGASQTGAAK